MKSHNLQDKAVNQYIGNLSKIIYSNVAFHCLQAFELVVTMSEIIWHYSVHTRIPYSF